MNFEIRDNLIVSVFCFWTFFFLPPIWSFHVPALQPLFNWIDLIDRLKLILTENSHLKTPTDKYQTWLDVSFRDKREKVVQKIWYQINTSILDVYYSRTNYLTEKFAFVMLAHYTVISEVVIWPKHIYGSTKIEQSTLTA